MLPFGFPFRSLALLVLLGTTVGATAAEIQLRRECHARGNLIQLGHIADIYATTQQEADQLAAIEVMPTPASGVKSFVRVRQLQDLLAARGYSLAKLRFSGASQVQIERGVERSKQASYQPRIVRGPQESKKMVRDAITAHLRSSSDAEGAWQVEAALSDRQKRQIATTTGELKVQGGQAPWLGLQEFTIAFFAPEGPVKMQVEATVSIPRMVVVARRSLGRGMVLQADDLELRSGSPVRRDGKQMKAFGSIDELVGQETTRAVAAGQTLDKSYVRQPLLVRRGEVVTVYSRAAGIRVRTNARARDEGSKGELITVETLSDRKKFFARVSGPQQVDVYARAISTTPAERR